MKFNRTNLIFLLSGIALTGIAFVTISKNNAGSTIETPVKKCECGPTEHWFFKSCIKNYNKQFPDAKLPENNDTEGISENILQAIEMLALDMKFIDENGLPLNLELNTKGDLYLPLFKGQDFKSYKQILKNIGPATTLSAQNLYQELITQFNALKQIQYKSF